MLYTLNHEQILGLYYTMLCMFWSDGLAVNIRPQPLICSYPHFNSRVSPQHSYHITRNLKWQFVIATSIASMKEFQRLMNLQLRVIEKKAHYLSHPVAFLHALQCCNSDVHLNLFGQYESGAPCSCDVRGHRKALYRLASRIKFSESSCWCSSASWPIGVWFCWNARVWFLFEICKVQSV